MKPLLPNHAPALDGGIPSLLHTGHHRPSLVMSIVMRAILIYLFSFALVAQAVAADSLGLFSHPPFTNTISASAQKLLGTLKPGMTRAQLEKHFRMDGGCFSTMVPRYYLDDKATNRTVIMFEVAFRPAKMDEATFADPRKRSDWFTAHSPYWGQPDDIVVAVGTPYISRVSYD
jgi:hypothetical protein